MENLTRERALELHRQMWTDMQRDLGDCPDGGQRIDYKHDWRAKHVPNEYVLNDCFLCEYTEHIDAYGCDACPIRWPYEGEDDCTICYCTNYRYYYTAPISEILALPERRMEE